MEVSIASLIPVGGQDDLQPECPRDDLPRGDGVWNILRIKVDALDPTEWPVEGLAGAPGYLFNPIEMVRYCRGETYRHVIGPGSAHEVAPLQRGLQRALAPGEGIEVEVATVLRTPALQDNPTLVALAHDQQFEPIARGHANKEAVKAIQRALRACQYDVGRFGPDRDGIDGDFGATTERIVKQFQETRLKEVLDKAGDAGIAGKKSGDLRVDGKVDWLTLMGLDMCAATHRHAPPQGPEPSTAPPPPRPLDPPSAPAILSNTFDATKGTAGLSMHFGIRMYKELLNWLWRGTWNAGKAADGSYQGDCNGVGYSTTHPHHYGSEQDVKDKKAALRRELSPEWPDVNLPRARAKKNGKDVTVSIGGKSYPIYRCFGVNWVGTNFTNCCNSQMAALACALGGGEFAVKGERNSA